MVTVESKNESYEIKKEIYTIIAESVPGADESGISTEGYEATIFPLIVDRNLGDPGCLSRENGIKITILSKSKNQSGKTIWAYEKYATGIIRRIFSSPYGEKFGFVSVLFVDASDDEDIILLTLNAADSLIYSKGWENEESYICSLGWSDIKPGAKSAIVFYEKNNGSLCSALSYDNLKSSSFANDAYFKDYVTKIYPEIAASLDKIDKYSKMGDCKNVVSSAAALNARLFEVKVELKEISVSEQLSGKKIKLMDIVFCLSDAMSDYWYFGEYSDSDALLRASLQAEEEFEKFSELAAAMNIEPYQTDLIINSKDYHFIDTHPLGEAFYYQDKSKANDLSVMVSDWSAATKLLTKDKFTGEKEETKAAFDSIFLIAVVEFAHHDYRGGGVDGISTPALNAFTLYYNGDE